jgi:ABC-type uncharacterized transport system auxiliary subunit
MRSLRSIIAPSLLPVLLIASVLAAAPGCIGGEVVQRSYFTLDYPMDRVAEGVKSHGVTVLVRRFATDLAYDKNEIVYRQSPYSFGYYTYKLWASKPRKMLQQLVTTHLRRSEVVSEITDQLGDSEPTYELRGEVMAIEEVNSSDEQWLARLSLRLWLTKYGQRRVVWSWEFDETRPVPERSPFFVVKTLSEILASQLEEATRDLDARLESVAGGTEPVPPKVKKPKAPKVTTPEVPPDRVEPSATRIR